MTTIPSVISINISPGGIPKLPVAEVFVATAILRGDGRLHDKHLTPERAVSLIDEEILQQLRQEGFPVDPGVMGENLTVQNLDIQHLQPGTRLRFAGGVEIELTALRKPCYVLDAIHPVLKDACVGRCGFLARVVTEGLLRVGEEITAVKE
ncbi:MAG: MOSC domain-containing protein [Armatimonadota bacterium]